MNVSSKNCFEGFELHPCHAAWGKNCIVVITSTNVINICAGQGAILDLSGVVRLVLDESDRMLDIGFANDMHKIVAAVNADASRRDPECSLSTWMFTATWPTSELSGFTREILQAGTLFVAAGHVVCGKCCSCHAHAMPSLSLSAPNIICMMSCLRIAAAPFVARSGAGF